MDNKIKMYIADNTEFRDELIKNLNTDEITVIGNSNDGQTAINEIVVLNPDILILDIVLPNQDGFSVIENLKQKMGEKCPKIIVASALIHEGFISKALSLGANYYINKPCSIDTILKRIKDVS